jgi:hypothetical protein
MQDDDGGKRPVAGGLAQDEGEPGYLGYRAPRAKRDKQANRAGYRGSSHDRRSIEAHIIPA